MNQVAIVTDSNSGITQEQAKALGIYVLAMPFSIDGVTYLEGVTLTQKEFYQRMEEGADITTSQPSPESVMKLWDDILKDYDSLVHIPMSSSLSGSCSTAAALALDYEGRVAVVDNQRISVTQRQSVLDAVALARQGMAAEKIRERLEETKAESSIYVMVDTLKYLRKGGRITAAAAALGTVLKLKPVLQIQGGKLDAFAKARTIKQAKSIMQNAIEQDIMERFGGKNSKEPAVYLQIAHTSNEEAASKLVEELKELYPGYEVYLDDLSLSISCHLGPGALAIACSKKL